MFLNRRDVLHLAFTTVGLTVAASRPARAVAPAIAARSDAQTLASLARVQSAREVHGRPAEAVSGARLCRYR